MDRESAAQTQGYIEEEVVRLPHHRQRHFLFDLCAGEFALLGWLRGLHVVSSGNFRYLTTRTSSAIVAPNEPKDSIPV
jgi:hypothetical protein